jgi:hypothetical protein
MAADIDDHVERVLFKHTRLSGNSMSW